MNDNHSLATNTLLMTPDGFIPHQKRNNTANNTQYTISLEDPHAYAMLATLDSPIRI